MNVSTDGAPAPRRIRCRTGKSQLDALIDKFLTLPAGEERTAALRESCDLAARDANVIPLVTKDAIIAYRQAKVSPTIPTVEGYAVPLR